jgi:hypothetical protein
VKNLIIGFLLGSAVTAAAIALMHRDPPARITLPTGDEPDARSAGVDAVEGAPAAEPPRSNAVRVPAKPSAPAHRPTSDAAGDFVQPTESPAPPDIPGGALDEAGAAREPLEELFGSFRIDCQYGPGYGGRWPEGTLLPHTAAWQGGPITFDTVDLDAGTARLKNSSGLTRTLDGELEVRVHATRTGLHFTVFAPGGELIVATVYGALDAERRNLAVVSFHGPGLDHESAQFYGACTLA